MTASQKTLPIWILIVSGVFALMELMVSIMLYFSPLSVVETIDLSAKGMEYVISMWATRQFALGVIFAFATIKKSAQMLIISYIFFFVIFLGDILVGIKQNEITLIISALVMCGISAVMIYFINKNKQ